MWIRCILCLLVVCAGVSLCTGWYYGMKFGVGSVCDEMRYYYPDHLPVRGCGEKGGEPFAKPEVEKKVILKKTKEPIKENTYDNN